MVDSRLRLFRAGEGNGVISSSCGDVDEEPFEIGETRPVIAVAS